MALPDVPGLDTLPPWAQGLVTAIVGIAAAIPVLRKYLKEPDEKAGTKDVVVATGYVPDMAPFREMATDIRRAADALETLARIAEEREAEAEDADRAARINRDRKLNHLLELLERAERKPEIRR